MKQLLAILFSALCTLTSWSQGFQNVTDSQSIDVENIGSTFGNGISFADFNGDGWDDLSFATNAIDPIFYVNTEGNYMEIDLGITNEPQGDIKAILWVDYDNDGDKDLFISTSYHPVKLYNNDGFMNLTDVTAAVGFIDQTTRNFGACWGDYNNDGWLDLYLCKYHNPDWNTGYAYENHLYRSNMDGTFIEVANFAGVEDGVLPSFQSVFFDFDNDGLEDIYVINDRLVHQNTMYKNMGDGTFTDVSEITGTDLWMDAMSITVGDYDNDQDLDLYLANTNEGNVFLQNQGDGTFIDVAEELGVIVYEICWGSMWIDYDNDMLQDLFVSTINNVGTTEMLNVFYKNTGEEFLDFTEEAFGIDDFHATLAVSMGDYNNDGFPDFVENNVSPSKGQLYKNGGTDNNWLKISVEGVITNRDGIGAWVQVYTDSVVQTRTVNCGEEYLGQDSPREMFGLADKVIIDSVKVKWPSGIIDMLHDVDVNQTLHIVEGSSTILPIAYEGELLLCGPDSTLLVAAEGSNYMWSNGAETQAIYVTEEGEYSCVVTVDGGLTLQTETITITSSPEIVLDLVAQDAACYGAMDGIALVGNSDGSLLTSIEWEQQLSGFVVDSLAAGVYLFTTANEFGCVVSDSIVISQPDSLIITALVTDALCFGEASGQVEFSWTGGTGNSICENGGLNTDALGAGIYDWLCTDQNDCEASISFEIEEPEELIVDLTTTGISGEGNGSAEIEINGGTPEYTIEWSTGEDELSIDVIDEGDFWVTVSDENGCDTTLTFAITSVHEIDKGQFTVFPNPFSNQFTFSNTSTEEALFQLSNPLGQIVYTNNFVPGVHVIDLEGMKCSGIWILRISQNQNTYTVRLASN